MASVTSLTMRMQRLLDHERAAHDESDRQAAENARLLERLSEHTSMLERVAEEQAAVRRVATLVAGQAAANVIFTAVAEEVVRLLRADLGGVARYEADESLTLVAASHCEGDGLPIGLRFEVGDDFEQPGCCGPASRSGSPTTTALPARSHASPGGWVSTRRSALRSSSRLAVRAASQTRRPIATLVEVLGPAPAWSYESGWALIACPRRGQTRRRIGALGEPSRGRHAPHCSLW
jgi:hypothetical protein